MQTAEKTLTYPDYLALEAGSGVKHEYLNGVAVAMSGGTHAHAFLCTRAALALARLESDGCRAYGSELRIRVEASGLATYPDATLVCEPRFHDEDPDAVVNPRVIVEVLSPNTRDYDLGTKFEHYRSMRSLQYVLYVEQSRVGAVLRSRVDGMTWRFRSLQSGDRVELGDHGGFALDVLYDGLDLP